jgi:hypothetical protein
MTWPGTRRGCGGQASRRSYQQVFEFGFYRVTPRLLLDLPFKWRDLVPGAAVCCVAALIVHAVLSFFLRNWLAEYGHA